MCVCVTINYMHANCKEKFGGHWFPIKTELRETLQLLFNHFVLQIFQHALAPTYSIPLHKVSRDTYR